MQHSEMTIEQIADAIKVAETTEKAAKSTKKQLEAELSRRYEERAGVELARRDLPFGTVNIQDGTFQIKYEAKKKVEWDQDILAALYARIEKDGGTPTDFINREVAYKIDERIYKTWGDNVRGWFDPARTVSPDGVKITVTESGAR